MKSGRVAETGSVRALSALRPQMPRGHLPVPRPSISPRLWRFQKKGHSSLKASRQDVTTAQALSSGVGGVSEKYTWRRLLRAARANALGQVKRRWRASNPLWPWRSSFGASHSITSPKVVLHRNSNLRPRMSTSLDPGGMSGLSAAQPVEWLYRPKQQKYEP